MKQKRGERGELCESPSNIVTNILSRDTLKQDHKLENICTDVNMCGSINNVTTSFPDYFKTHTNSYINSIYPET